MGEKILIAMSGGVDSSVAAAILKEQGYEPVGVTMRLWNLPEEEQKKSCCSLDDVNDARRVAHSLGIPHYTLNMQKEFKTHVVDYFVNQYLEGRTPNPCIACNRVLKFELLVEKARGMGIGLLATGHYARIEEEDGRHLILRGRDEAKDQSYFLFDIPPENLPRIRFPLGGLTKPEVREHAEKLGLTTAQKEESQEICFVPGDDYKAFIRDYGGESPPGDFVDTSGRKLGEHTGISDYTVGQRRGLGLAHHERLYVVRIEADTNRVVLGSRADLATRRMRVTDTTWHLPLHKGEDTLVQIRYRSRPVPVRVMSIKDKSIDVEFPLPVTAVAPGQAAVFYRGEAVAGGGWIESFSA